MNEREIGMLNRGVGTRRNTKVERMQPGEKGWIPLNGVVSRQDRLVVCECTTVYRFTTFPGTAIRIEMRPDFRLNVTVPRGHVFPASHHDIPSRGVAQVKRRGVGGLDRILMGLGD